MSVFLNKQLCQGVSYKAENWHASSHEQYFSKYRFLDICWCVSNRKLLVNIKNYYSQFCQIKHRVPQASILGPSLFLLYVNDRLQSFPNNLITASVTKSLHEDRGPCYLHLSIYFIHTLSSSAGKWKVVVIAALFSLAN